MARHLADSLPRSATRSWWLGLRAAARSADRRAARGLPQHPANDLIDCPDCEGFGEHLVNGSRGQDPQSEYSVTCGRCGGAGEILDGQVDLLVQLRAARYVARHIPSQRFPYESARRRAVMPCPGLMQADMLARAQMCQNETERALAAWRVAA